MCEAIFLKDGEVGRLGNHCLSLYSAVGSLMAKPAFIPKELAGGSPVKEVAYGWVSGVQSYGLLQIKQALHLEMLRFYIFINQC